MANGEIEEDGFITAARDILPGATPATLIPPSPIDPPGGKRYDEGKNRLDLLPPEWVWALGSVTTEGSKVYAERNWELGMKWSKPVGCALRHLFKWLCGETYDIGTPAKPGTGCHHLAMVAWNCLSLMSYQLRGVGENDLPWATSMALLERIRVEPAKKETPQ